MLLAHFPKKILLKLFWMLSAHFPMRMLKVNRYMGELYFTWKNPLNLPRDEYVCIKYWHKVLTLFVSQWMHLFGITLSHLISTNQETAFHSLLNSSPDAHRLKKFILFTTLRDPSLVLMPNKEPVIIKKKMKKILVKIHRMWYCRSV